MTEPAGSTSRRRWQVIGAAVAVVVAIVVVVIATRSDDSGGSTAGTDVVDIGGPATVTGITGAAPVSETSETSDASVSIPASTVNGETTTSAGGQTLVLQRTLLEPGTYDCTDTGVWQPFADLEVTLLVGEPAGGSSCTSDVLDMPLGACSKTACSEVPEDWRFDTLAGTPPQTLLMVAAPVSTTTSEFVCVVDLVPQPKQILADTTTIEEACPAGATLGSSDIPPYVPPDTSDIPYVPPPVSVDLPAG